MTRLLVTTVVYVLVSVGTLLSCPDSCCKSSTKFQLEEDKCVLTRSTQKLTALIINEMGKKDGNVFISPFSVSNVLRLLLLASQGDTSSELSHALSHQAIDVHTASKCLMDAVYDSTGETLNSTNDFFISSEYKSSVTSTDSDKKNSNYKKLAEEHYRASFYNCNFENRPESARKRINKIVRTKTGDLIPDLFEPGTISNETKLIIVNTISFKSSWLQKFDKTKSASEPFRIDRDNITRKYNTNMTMFMKVEGNFTHQWLHLPTKDGKRIGIEVVDMPYESTEYSMMAIKFTDDEFLFRDLSEIEKYIAEGGILNIRDMLIEYPLHLTFPRFRMEYDRDLNEIFTPVTGLGIIFSPRADYGKFADGLFISNIIHKAVIEVTEEGTLASGASGGSFIQRQNSAMVFNSPFVFYIYHSCDGLVLFQGRYAYPTTSFLSSVYN